MAGGFNLRGLIPALILATIIGAVGAYSLASSQYSDVGSLASLEAPLRVTVSGSPVDLGAGEYYMMVGGEAYLVSARGYYAIARPLGGGASEGYALFILRGENGFTVVALYPLEEFVAKYGTAPIVEDELVVRGVYRPEARVAIDLGGGPIELPVLEVEGILKGCHASYSQPQANVAG